MQMTGISSGVYWDINVQGPDSEVTMLRVPSRKMVDVLINDHEVIQSLIDEYVDTFCKTPVGIKAILFERGRPQSGHTYAWSLAELLIANKP